MDFCGIGIITEGGYTEIGYEIWLEIEFELISNFVFVKTRLHKQWMHTI
jgi:hypothetical protein